MLLHPHPPFNKQSIWVFTLLIVRAGDHWDLNTKVDANRYWVGEVSKEIIYKTVKHFGPKDVEANRPIGVDVRVVDPGCERYL